MKKILRAFLLLAVFSVVKALADDWAVLDSSGKVKRVIVATSAAIKGRKDGPWIKTSPHKVGIGWKYNGKSFVEPVTVVSKLAVVYSTCNFTIITSTR